MNAEGGGRGEGRMGIVVHIETSNISCYERLE